MLNIEGKVSVTKIDVQSKLTKATVYFGTPKAKGSDEWDNSFFNAKFVGKAHDKIVQDESITDKTTIFVTSGVVTNKQYQNKEKQNRSFLEVTIFDFIYGQEMEEHLTNLKASKGGNTQQTSIGRGGRGNNNNTGRGGRGGNNNR